MSNERADMSDGGEPLYFRGDCAIVVENNINGNALEGYPVVTRLSPTSKSPPSSPTSRENHNGDSRTLFGESLAKTWCSIGLMVLFSVLVILFSRAYLLDILLWLESLPLIWSVLVFVVLFTFVSFPFAFGYIVLNMMAGYLYGFFTGQFVVSASVTLGLVISIGLCRRYFASYAQAHFTSMPMLALMRVLEGPSGLKVMALARLTPIPFGIQNAMVAMTNTDLWHCLLASVVGLTPTQLLNTYMGSTVRNMQEVLSNRADGYVIMCAQIVFSVALVAYIGRKAKTELDKLTPSEESTLSQGANKSVPI